MLSIIIPTYNEALTIEDILRRINSELASREHRIIVIDDNSPDSTAEIAEAVENVVVLKRPNKIGIGSALRYGMIRACELGTEYIITLDGDLSHDPADILRLVSYAGHENVIIGSRYIENSKSDLPISRHYLSKIGSYIIRLFLRIPAKDTTGGFRVYSPQYLHSILLSKDLPISYDFQLALLTHLFRKKINIIEVPIHFSTRKAGKSKLTNKDIYISFNTVWKLWLKQ